MHACMHEAMITDSEVYCGALGAHMTVCEQSLSLRMASLHALHALVVRSQRP